MTESQQAMKHVRSFAGEARGTLATVAVLGNWEHQVGAVGQMALESYRSAGVDLLVNRALSVDVGGVPLTLVGLDDPVLGRPDISKARQAVVPGSTEIWLVHAPGVASSLPAITPARPALLLAGHTHGGQIRIPFLPPVRPTGAGRFLEGWYYDTLAPMYVSRGIGTTGIPARFRCSAELPVFTLRTASAPQPSRHRPRAQNDGE
jgi:hypothetical protein